MSDQPENKKPEEAVKDEAPLRQAPRMTESMLRAQRAKNDSFNVPVGKSPWMVYAMLQIPIVIIMAILIYVLWSQTKG